MERPRALISVWDKTGIEDLAAALNSMNWEIISTGGTASKLRKAGLEVTDVSDVSGHPEILDGRVKLSIQLFTGEYLPDATLKRYADSGRSLAMLVSIWFV